MIDLGSTEFYLAVPSVPEEKLRRLSSSLFDSWEAYVGSSLSLEDYSLFLQVEEGSVNGIARIGALLGVLYIGIGNYGSFVSGIKTIGEQIGATSDFLTERAGTVFSCPDSQATTRKRGGTIPALQRLFAKVQRGELTPEEAIVRAEDLLGEDGASSPGFMHDLVESLHNCPRHHEQQLLELAEEPDSIDPVVGRTPQKPRLPRSTPDLGPLLHLRVEVWRDSKKKRKHTRVVKL